MRGTSGAENAVNNAINKSNRQASETKALRENQQAAAQQAGRGGRRI
jgi:hypothetical protein